MHESRGLGDVYKRQYNYGIGDGGYIEIHEMISDMKVEVDVGEDKYVTKGSTLKLNGEVLYK